MNPKIKKVYVDSDSFYVRKSILGYRVVYPIKREDGSMNWFNLFTGGWANLIFVIICVSMLLWITVDTNNQIEEYKEKCTLAMEKPVEFCRSIGFYDQLDKTRSLPGVKITQNISNELL